MPRIIRATLFAIAKPGEPPGPIDVPAYPTSSPYFVVHRKPDFDGVHRDPWVVTHVPTGYRVFGFRMRADALRWVALVQDDVDWNFGALGDSSGMPPNAGSVSFEARRALTAA